MTRLVLLATATAGWALLVYLTLLVTRISSWVVYNDPVWAKMDADGLGREHMILETVHQIRMIPVPLAVIFGILFLGLLYQVFFVQSAVPDFADRSDRMINN